MSNRAIGHGASDYHMITTTHPYMVELGLGSFTMGSLYSWWNERSSDGTYLHRLCINNDRANLETPANKLPQLLGITSDTEFFWYGWKPNRDIPNAGVYKRFDFFGFEGNGGGNDPWAFYSAAVRRTVTTDDTLLGDMGNHQEPVVGGKVDQGTFTAQTSSLAANPVHERDVLAGLSPIYHLTNFNRYMSAFYSFFPRSTWEEVALLGPTIGGKDTEELFASHELLVDIKASKMGQYIEWSGEVTFFINEGVLCAGGITEWIPFKLYLFDGANAVSNKTVTLKSIKLTGPARDVVGGLYKSSEDSERTAFDPKDPASQKVGDVDLTMNPITKKWESGSPVLFAMMETDLGKAITPDIGGLQTSNIQLALNSEEYTYSKFIPTTGIAMPIRPQNGNPHQWQPNYLKPKEVRCETGEDTKKETLKVYNFSSQSNFSKGDSVMLTRIDGVWHVSAIGPKIDEFANVETSVGKWGEFTYMMTNSEYFFKNVDGTSFTPRDAEQYFHFLYHKGDRLNAGLDRNALNKPIGVDYGTDGGWDSDQPFNTMGVSNVELKHGYAQTTSFDYLDSQIFGIRKKAGMYATGLEDKCSIATTSALRTAGGQIIEPPGPNYTTRNAAWAGVFFGCLFPDGYTGASKYFAPRDWNIDAKSSGDMVNTDFYLDTFTSWPNYGKYPFNAGTANLIGRTSHRNNCRQPGRAYPFEDISEGGNLWSRADSRASANLFAEDSSGTKLTQFFRSIPADVMTNASPTGKNGSPLYPVHRFKDFHDPLQAGTGTRLLADKAFLYGVWLGKTPLSGDLEDPDESAFDFKPISRNTLMFRPLKMEAYIQFGEKQNSSDKTYAKNLDKEYARTSRIGFSSEARRTQLDWNRPATGFFENREESEADGGFWTPFGMKWGKEIEGKPRYGNLHDFNYWNENHGPMKWTLSPPYTNGPGNWKGAGAFGVITTFNTVTANSQIDINTDNLYGMGAAAKGKYTIGGGYEHQVKTWGVSSFQSSYQQANIIDLSVRIYQQHPRDQTLFDPRTFAVHHFNPDVRLRDGHFLEADGIRTPLTPFRLFEKEVQAVRDANDTSIKAFYKRYKERSVVDLRVISRYEKEIDIKVGADLHVDGVTYSAIQLSAGEYVLADATLSSAGGRQTPLIASSLWPIDDVRVGKLLPFRYETLVLGIPTPEDVEFSVIDPAYAQLSIQFTPGGVPAQNIKDVMIIKNIGTGYKIGDIVGLSSREVRFKVTLVETGDDPSASPPVIKGQILALQCKSHGKGITASETAPYGKVFDANSEGLLKITTLGSDDGKDFDAYFVAAKVYKEVHTDPKPYLMKRGGEEIIRVASSNSQGTHLGKGEVSSAQDGSFIDESRETTFILDPTLYSANKQYDIFFHFHNDITMTWLAGAEDFHGDGIHNRLACSEQHITVNINPR